MRIQLILNVVAIAIVFSQTTSEKKSCPDGYECALYYQCNNSLVDEKEEYPCPDYLEVCCAVENKTIVKRETPNKCGIINIDGIGFKITESDDHEANYGEFPWTIGILKEETEKNQSFNVYHCAGSLIHPRVVLTTARCSQNISVETLKIRAGEWDTQTKLELYPHQDRNVTEVIVHEQYNEGSMFNDIALLILEEPVELAENVQTICLPPANAEFDLKRCKATGWGKDSSNSGGKWDPIMQKIDLPVIPRDKCQNILRSTHLGKDFELHGSFICAGGEVGRGTWKGDLGSPLVCPITGTDNQNFQAGIFAWGDPKAEKIPGVYTSVAGFRTWLDVQLTNKKIESSYYTP